ncbi:MAG: nucleotidyltransferase domain-containing protein [Gammaproteobacteria bacterium]|nr:nucleotidyltransferase domain-containing protein [Gammaproteobacteria bacterium]
MERHKDDLCYYKIYIFGSRSRGTQHSRSDFDIGIYGNRPVDLKLFYEIEDELDNLPTLYKIDWVDLNRSSKNLQEQALKKGRLIYG